MKTCVALITPTELQGQDFDGAFCTIIDARRYADYMAGHIPGAMWMGWEMWCAEAPGHAGQTLAQPGYWGVLREGVDEGLQELLRRAGLREERPVLVYADGPASKGREARVAWMLLYLGVSSVTLLDGGWRGWLKHGGGEEMTLPEPSYSQFCVRVQERRRIRVEQLRRDLQGDRPPLLIDARSRAEFAGECYDYQPRVGRLPGAVHLPYTDFFDEEGRFVTKSVYLQRLPSEVRKAERCVAYCEVGVRSCIFALLHELYTGKVVANFDGSFMEWALDKTLPVERDVE